VAELRRFLKLPFEVAGQLLPSFGRCNLKVANVRRGLTSMVAFPQVPLSFHTHPWTCPTAPGKGRACYLDAPSPGDIAALLTCSVRKPRTLAHIVFTTSGCYLMAVTASAKPARAVAACRKLFASVDHKTFMTASDGERFRARWLQCMHQQGIRAEYYPSAEECVLCVHAT
jgi:hypothetical protein